MNASKENAGCAIGHLEGLLESLGTLSQADALRVNFLLGFLQAAQRKLPTEAAYAKDKARERTK